MNILRKYLVIGITIIFVGASITMIPKIGAEDESLFFDDFNDNTKDYIKWAEIDNNGTWDEINQRTEFQLYETGGYSVWESIESSEFTISLTSTDGIQISWDMITQIGSTGQTGRIGLKVTDGTNWIWAEYYQWYNYLWFMDSNDVSATILDEDYEDGSWPNWIRIFSDKYYINLANINSYPVFDSVFTPGSNLTIILYLGVGGYQTTIFTRSGFDNVLVQNISGVEEPEPVIGLVGYWDFNEGTGNVVYDNSECNNNGTIYGATWTDGICGSALEFSGSSSSYIDCGTHYSLNTINAMTISVWIKPNTLRTYQDIIFRSTSSPYKGYTLEVCQNPSMAKMLIQGMTRASADYEIPIGNWTHIAVSRKAGGTYNIYINGLNYSSWSHTTSPHYAITDFIIGGSAGTGGWQGRDFDGVIDEVRIYNIALDAYEIEDLFLYPCNQPPIAVAGGPYEVDECSEITFNASASIDPDEDELQYRWDFDNDEIWDTNYSTDPTATNIWYDDYYGTVAVEVYDGAETDTATATITVYNVAPVITSLKLPIEPVHYSNSINLTANFTNVGILDTHTATIDWGDETTSYGTITGSNGVYTVMDTKTYTQAGVYTMTLTVEDDNGGNDTEIFQYVVVYDPNAGFVTGGGWITSVEGAYYPDTSLTGKASFGFVAKYIKGEPIPTGNTEFNFKVANLNFHSKNYSWLMVNQFKAKYKGEGTINNMGNYGFMVSVIDEDLTESTDVDLFRIKIWDKNNNDEVVYDNQLGDPEDSDPTTAIGGGNIKIHLED
jgi:hypothetical protein